MNDAMCALQAALRRFAQDREWEQFHTPKNLAAALCVEAAELLEHFQWLSDEQSSALGEEKRAAVEHELADVLIYLLQLSDKLGVDLEAAAWRKIQINAAKYPVDRAKGNMKKYSEF